MGDSSTFFDLVAQATGTTNTQVQNDIARLVAQVESVISESEAPVVIAVGQSPEVIAACLRSYGFDVRTLTVSGVRDSIENYINASKNIADLPGVNDGEIQVGTGFMEQIQCDVENSDDDPLSKIADFFDRIEVDNARDVFILDYSDTGKSMDFIAKVAKFQLSERAEINQQISPTIHKLDFHRLHRDLSPDQSNAYIQLLKNKNDLGIREIVDNSRCLNKLTQEENQEGILRVELAVEELQESVAKARTELHMMPVQLNHAQINLDEEKAEELAETETQKVSQFVKH